MRRVLYGRPRVKRTIPHQIVVYGRLYDVKWGTKKDPSWDPKVDVAMVVDGYTRRGQESFAIILNPKIRHDSRLAHEALLHEVMHIVNNRERAWRKEHPTDRKDRSATMRWRPLSHDAMHLMDLPLARALFDNGALFQCCCRRCRRKK